MRDFCEIPDKKSVLLKIARLLNKSYITWGLGGSMLLYYYGIVDDVNDIDILIDIRDLDKFEKVIKGYDFKHENGNEKYTTAHLFSVNLDGVEFDFLLDFRIKLQSGEYVFPFGKGMIERRFLLDGEMICLSFLKEWKNAYHAMNRETKYRLIEAYFDRNKQNY